MLRARQAIANWPKVVWLHYGAKSPVVLRLRSGLKVSCRPQTSDWTVVHEMCLGGSYSAAFRYLAKRERRGVVLDLGANIGCFSLLCAAAHPQAQVAAYEPETSNAAVFRRNLELNPDVAGRIALATRAVSGAEGTARLNISRNLAGSNIIDGQVDAFTRTTQVSVASFATIVQQMPGPIELVKMDVEGSEYSIVDETPAEVWERVPAIAMEIHEDTSRGMDRTRLIQRFESFGYTASSDRMGSWFFERTAPRWRRSPLASTPSPQPHVTARPA